MATGSTVLLLLSRCRCEQLCIFPAGDRVKAPGSLMLWSSIPINKQVSKRGQITVKPSKDGCVWNNPRRQVNQRDPHPTLGSVSGFTKVQGLGLYRYPPRCSKCCCCYSGQDLKVGKKLHLKNKQIFAVKYFIVLPFFCSIPFYLALT